MGAPSVETVSNAKPVATGGIKVAPLGTELPDDVTTAVDAAFLGLGYVNEDGLRPEGERNVETVRDWGGDVIAQLQTDHSSRFVFTLYGVFDEAVLRTVFGESRVVATGSTIKVEETGEELPHLSWCFDMLGSGGKKIRIVIGDGQVSTVAEAPMVAGALQSFELTVEAFKVTGSDVKVNRYYEKPAVVTP